MTDFKIAKKFFEMLKGEGVKVQETNDGGPGFQIFDHISDKPTLEFCFHEDGSYWRIMGFLGDYFSDEIHKQGWASE